MKRPIQDINTQKGEFPLTECLEDTEKRVLAYWHSEIAPTLKVVIK